VRDRVRERGRERKKESGKRRKTKKKVSSRFFDKLRTYARDKTIEGVTHEHGDSVLSSGSAERTIGGNGNGRDVTGVTEVVGAELALGEFPDLSSDVVRAK
jgi:hypothetical protein